VIQEKRLVVSESHIKEEYGIFFRDGCIFAYDVFRPETFDQQILAQWKCHVLAYAEMLFRWQLLNKRLELLKSAKITTFHVNNRDAVFGTK